MNLHKTKTTGDNLGNQPCENSNQGVPQDGIWKQVAQQVFTKSSLKKKKEFVNN